MPQPKLVPLEAVAANKLTAAQAQAVFEELRSYRAAVKPHSTTVDDKGQTRIEAPYQAVVRLNRTHSSGAVLWQSRVNHQHYVSLSIHTAQEIIRDGSNRRLYESGTIITVYMTASQFATLITSFGGEGVPATLGRFCGEMIEGPENLVDDVNDASERIKAAGRDAIESLFNIRNTVANWQREGKRPTLKEVTALLHELDCRLGNIPKNFAFVQTLLEEQMEETVQQVRTEVAAQIDLMLHTMGLEQASRLKGPQTELLDGNA